MERQGNRLENLFYEDRDQTEITHEQVYYKPHNCNDDLEDDDCNKKKKGSNRCSEGNKCLMLMTRTNSSRFW